MATTLADDIITLASTLLIAIVSIIAAFVAARFTEKYRNASEARLRHLEEIKAKVLTPLMKQIDQYYTPVLSFRISNLTTENVQIKKYAASLAETPLESEIRLSIPKPDSSETASWVVKPELVVDQELYKDCSLNHFSQFFKAWEKFVSQVGTFNKKCLDFANKLNETASKAFGIPVGKSWEAPGSFVVPAFGLLVYQRMVGIQTFPLSGGLVNGQYGKVYRVNFGNQVDVYPSEVS